MPECFKMILNSERVKTSLFLKFALALANKAANNVIVV